MQNSENFNDNHSQADDFDNQVTAQSHDDANPEQSQAFMSDIVHADIENHLVIDVPVLEILGDNQPTTQAAASQENSHQTTAEEVNGFATLGLSTALLRSLSDSGYTQPTPIQAQAIPPAMAGRDLLLSAQTGSGKTAAFVLPILDLISQSQSKNRAVRALILTPTRELAQQVSDSIRRYGSHMKDLFCVPLVGGAPYSGQIRALKKGVQIIIATPGRLLDHMGDNRIDLSNLSVLVLDEADRMLDMGFSDDITRILQETPSNRQTIMSSATWDGPVGKIAESFTRNPERVAIKVESAHIDEKVYFCDDFNHKNKLLESLVCDKDLQQAIVFTATKRSSEQLAERLQDWGHKACFLHGDLPQNKRNRILADVKAGKYDIVVATDVAARGIDVPAISHVFNYDLPRQVEDYVHRIGRCGRAGRTGIAINLCSRDDRSQFAQINRYLKREMTEATVEGLEPRFIEKAYDRGNAGRNNRSGGRPSGRTGGFGGGRSSDSRGDSRSNGGGYKGSNSGSSYAGNREGSRSGDNRSNSGSQDRFGGERRGSNSNGGYQGSNSNSNSGGYRGDRSNDRSAAPRPSHGGSNSNGQDQNSGKMLTSHEFNFFNKSNSGRGDRPDRGDRNDRPQFDRSHSDRPQQRSEGGRSDGGRSQFSKPFGDRNSDSRSNDRSNDRSGDSRGRGGYAGQSAGQNRNSSYSNGGNSERRGEGQGFRSERPAFDRASQDRAGYQGRQERSGSDRSDRPQAGAGRGGFGKPAGGYAGNRSTASGEGYARRPRQDEGASSRKDGDKPVRRQSSFAGGSDRRDSTGKPV